MPHTGSIHAPAREIATLKRGVLKMIHRACPAWKLRIVTATYHKSDFFHDGTMSSVGEFSNRPVSK